MPRKRELKVDPARAPSRIMTKDEVRFVLNRELAPIVVSERTLDQWVARELFPAAIAVGGIRASGKAVRAVWLREEVEAFLDGLSLQPRLKAPKVWEPGKNHAQPA